MADWEEVKRLAADFQRAQLTSTIQRLSERNCIEIVQRLIDLKLIDVIYTTDGKEYLTPTEITKEIREELIVHGGRINLVDLQQIVNIDFSHVEARANDIARTDKNITLVLGQLIDESYLDRIAEEVNDLLQEQGQITVGDLTKTYDLPSDFLRDAVKARLGTLIRGKLDDYDKDVLYTESFVTRQRAKIRGAFSAITRPTQVTSVMHCYSLQERLFYNILDELVNQRHLAGSIAGGRQDKALYVPDMYTKAQNEWVDSFLRQNGYLEYDAVQRQGISDPKTFIKKRYKNESLVYLSTCCVGQLIQDQVEAEVDEAVTSKGWTDIMPNLPSICSAEDGNQLLHKIIKSKQGVVVVCDTIVTSDSFIQECSKPFEQLMAVKAEQDAKKNSALLLSGSKNVKLSGIDDGSSSRADKKEQRKKRQQGASKSGGGTQGREVKTKATKKKYGKNRDKEDDSDEELEGATSSKGQIPELVFLTREELEEEVSKQLPDVPPEFAAEVAAKLYRPLTKQYQSVARSVFLQSTGTDTGAARKKTHGQLQEKINGLWTNARLFEKGIKCFTVYKKKLSYAEDVQAQLIKHLLKTVCADISNLVVTAVATEHMLQVKEDTEMSHEVRMKLISKVPDDKVKATLSKLESSLSGKALDDFFEQLDTVCGPATLGISLKKPDKKKERQMVFGHRQALAEQLREETDPAMVLHLASVLMFQVFTQCMVHAPGKVVPQLVAFLKEHLQEESHQVLTQCQDLVMKQLKKQDEEGETIAEQLADLVPKVKDIALSARRGGANKEEKDEET